MKTITITYDGLTTDIKWSENVSPLEALGILRYHEKNVYAGMLNYNLSMAKDEVTLKKKDIFVKDLGLSVRTSNALISAKILTLSDLSKTSVRELLRIRGFGQSSLLEIRKIEAKYNFNL